jgi:mono/diheme cytochrome c family protein
MRSTSRLPAIRLSALAAACLVAIASGGTRPPTATPTQAITPDAARQARMEVHFAQVMAVHEAVIRGDLAATREPAAWLAAHAGADSLPEGSAPYVAAMREAAARTAAATSVLEVAMGTAAMLKTCGDCHRGLGTMPAAPLALPPTAVRGLVGHMLAHQHAADQMLQGLVVPSSPLWREGAAALATRPLEDEELPRDVKLGREAKASEHRIHVLAGDAGRVDDPAARAVFYGQILARCADCHAAHPKVWGPSRR